MKNSGFPNQYQNEVASECATEIAKCDAALLKTDPEQSSATNEVEEN